MRGSFSGPARPHSSRAWQARVLLLCLLLCGLSSRSYAAADSKGTDFWLTFPGNLNTGTTLTLFITGDVATTGTVSIASLSFNAPFTVTPGAVTSVIIPAGAELFDSDVIANNGIHVTAGQEVTVYGLNRLQSTTDAYLALPTDVLGTQYINLGYLNTEMNSVMGTQFALVGTVNGTVVTITPSVTAGTRTVGVPYNITLNQGQTYLLRSTGAYPSDLSGSIISSTQPIAVFGSNKCANVPHNHVACDHLVEQLPPTTAWGKQFVSVPLKTRLNGDTFRFLASTNNTQVRINGTLVATLNRGQYYEQIVVGSAQITSTQPILVAQYSNGSSYDGVVSDPFMMLIPPFEQFLGSYTVTTPASGFSGNYINVVAPTAAIGTVRLDGAVIAASNFSAIGTSGYSGAQLTVGLGVHQIAGGIYPVGVFVYGFDTYDSYGYPGGQSFAPVATVNTLALTPPTGTAQTGSQYCVAATVKDQFSNPVVGVRVDFAVSGANATSGFTNTDANGVASFCYTGTNGGTDNIVASIGGLSQTVQVVYVAPATSTTWIGSISTDWFTAGNWTNGVPTTTLDAIIGAGMPFNPLISAGTAFTRTLTLNSAGILSQTGGSLDVRGNLTNNSNSQFTGGSVTLGATTLASVLGSSSSRFWNLTVGSSGAQLSASAGASVRRVLTLTGSLTTQNNTFTLESNTTTGDAMVVNSGGVVVGNATVQRAIDPTMNAGVGYRHYSSPVANTTMNDMATSGFTPVVGAAYNISPTPELVTPYPTVFGYDQSRLTLSNSLDAFTKGFFSPSALTDPMVVGQGYTVNISANQTVDFVGTLNNGNITVNLARNSGPTAADAGWQFMGNPYPAPLDYSLVAPADRAGLEDAIYVYSSTSQYGGQYRAYINGIGFGNPVIPVAQGFFARMATPGTTSTFTFRNSQRLTSPNATTFQRKAADQRPLVQLELSMAGGSADTFYAYAEAGATPAFDVAYDAPKLPNSTGLNLASLVGSERLAIDGRPAFTATTTIPLTLSVPAAGTYSLSAAALNNLATDLSPYLRDNQTGQTVLLTAGTRYTFSVTAGQAAAAIVGRFTLQFSPVAAEVASLSVAEVAVYPNPAHERFTVQVPAVAAAASVQAELLNTLGQAVRRQTADQSATGTTLTLETAGLATGVYVLRLQAGSTTLTKRVVVQ